MSEVHFNNQVFGFGYSPKLHTLAIWCMVPQTRKHEVSKLIEEVIGAMLVKKFVDITLV